jgi:hypothetical protein
VPSSPAPPTTRRSDSAAFERRASIGIAFVLIAVSGAVSLWFGTRSLVSMPVAMTSPLLVLALVFLGASRSGEPHLIRFWFRFSLAALVAHAAAAAYIAIDVPGGARSLPAAVLSLVVVVGGVIAMVAQLRLRPRPSDPNIEAIVAWRDGSESLRR